MKVTVCFDNVRVVVPCGDGTLLVRDLMHESILRYRKATGKNDSGPTIISLSSLTGGGLLDPDDRLCDVADDREQIVAHLSLTDGQHHVGGDGASSVGTNSPDLFHTDSGNKEHYLHHYSQQHHHNVHRGYGMDVQSRINSNIKRESVKRLSMHVLSNREPPLSSYSALSLPRESRRREPLGQDSKSPYELTNINKEVDKIDVREVTIKNDAGPLGLHVVPCYDLLGNDQGLRVEKIDPNGRIAKDGQIELHDKIIKMNGNNLLRIPFTKVQDIFRTCMTEKILKITIIKGKKLSNIKTICDNIEKIDIDDGNVKKLQTSNNILQNANTRKIGRMIEIELIKGTNGLGFSVTTRDNPAGGHCPIYIKNILPKGAAVEDGRLRSGDRLLEVNNIEMTGKSQSEVVSLLRSIPAGGKVRITVSRQEEIAGSAATNDTANNNPINNDNLETSPDNARWNSSPIESIKIEPNEHDDKIFKGTTVRDDIALSPRKNRMILTLDIPVHDSEKAGLGVSVKGKTSTADDNTNMDLGIFIKSVIHGGAASRDGRLRTNDQLLNVNGVSLLKLSNSDAMETLRRAMLNTNSSVTGVITLTIARRISSYDNEKNFDNSMTTSSPTSSCKIETANSIYISDDNKFDSIVEKNNINSQIDIDDIKLTDNNIPVGLLTTPWNPVIERLTEYNKNSLRNESYCLATNKTWIDSVTGNVKKLIERDDDKDSILIEETTSSLDNTQLDVQKKLIDDKDSQYSGDITYDSQLSLEEFNNSSMGNKFSRDAVGRQSMSEKRHAALDAKNTDTYKRNKKLREGRENKTNDVDKTIVNDANKLTSLEVEQMKDIGENSFDSIRRRFDKKTNDSTQDYVYTLPGYNNKYSSPRKHWLVDDEIVRNDSTSVNNQFKGGEQVGEGFSNTRGDVKQASLNSALDKRSRKKGFKSMLRLGKNRKSLNFGDNIEARHESSNYCSVFRLVPRLFAVEQKRYRGKINIGKPKPPHYVRSVFGKFMTPFYPLERECKPIWELCSNLEIKKSKKTIREPNNYERIIVRECLNWFNNSRMIAILHKNSIRAEDQLDVAIDLRRANMYMKWYNSVIFHAALSDTVYEATLPLYYSRGLVIFSPEPNVKALKKIIRQVPQFTIMAGILDGTLLNVNDFLKYGTMDITEARGGLVQTLRTAGGGNLSRQLTHHQSTFVSRLDQIRDGEEIETDKINKVDTETEITTE